MAAAKAMKLLQVAASLVLACLALQATTAAAHFTLGVSDDHYTERSQLTPRLHSEPLLLHLIDRIKSRRPLRRSYRDEQPNT
uniref:Uncharacterized protein n=1 Tax=Oryza meridionalis TaxID=40149 RepID=A0A0E0CTN1_9ORYZ